MTLHHAGALFTPLAQLWNEEICTVSPFPGYYILPISWLRGGQDSSIFLFWRDSFPPPPKVVKSLISLLVLNS